MWSQLATETALLVRVASGVDEAAWREFHDRYAELVRGFALRCGLQPGDCDDVLQDVLLALARSLPHFRYDPARGRFRQYLSKIARHAIRRKICQKQHQPLLGDVQGAILAGRVPSRVEGHWQEEWQQYHLRRAMQVIRAEFNERDLAAFGRCAIEGCSPEGVAAGLAMSVASVYQAKSRILRRLKEVIALQVREEG